MSLNSLPTGLQNKIVQENYLERMFQESLKSKLAYREIAVREDFPNKVGETVTKSRPGLLVPSPTPLVAAAATDLDSGLTFNDFTVEQFELSVAQYGAGAKTNIVTEGVAIESKFLQDAKGLMLQSGQAVERVARNALFSAYTGGNTRVASTLGSANATVSVDDVRGFSAGDTVLVNGNVYTVDHIVSSNASTTTSTLVFADDTQNNMSGLSGTITFTSNVTTGDATANNSVINTKAPLIFRPNARATTAALQAGDTMQAIQIINAVANLRDNNVPDVDGFYNCYLSHAQLAGLQQDTIFQNYSKTNLGSDAFRKGFIVEGLGVRFINTTEAPIQALAGKRVYRAVIAGQGALVEGVYTNNGYKNQAGLRENAFTTIVDDIAHIVTGPLDATQQWVKQAWMYIGGFVAPTDTGTNSQVMPTANNASYKRAITLESL